MSLPDVNSWTRSMSRSVSWCSRAGRCHSRCSSCAAPPADRGSSTRGRTRSSLATPLRSGGQASRSRSPCWSCAGARSPASDPVTVPAGWRLRPDVRTRSHDDGRVVIGGSPRRVLRLTDRGAGIVDRLLDGHPVSGNGDAQLARRLLDAGIAHPVPSVSVTQSIEVVVPVYDDATGLSACLAALGSDLPVIVV